MTEYKTLRVPADDYEAAKASKRESETWGGFLRRCTDTPPEIREYVDAADMPDTTDTDIPDDLRDQLDRIEAAASTAESRTGSIEQTLEDLGGR